MYNILFNNKLKKYYILINYLIYIFNMGDDQKGRV